MTNLSPDIGGRRLTGRHLIFALVMVTTTGVAENTQTANPASVYCEQLDGTLGIVADSAGAQHGNCVFADGSVCDEWALFRGECGPTGSIPDPYAFCAGAGESGIISNARTGGALPASLVRPMVDQGLIVRELPPDIRNGTSWRCMGGDVWVCPVGANLPCSEKADLSREPTGAVSQYCQDNPGSSVVPAYVTGRATVYSWKCKGSAPSIDRQVFTADPAGFLAEFWHRLLPSTPAGVSE